MMETTYIEETVMEEMLTNTGQSILSISKSHPVMLIFLRHFGCTFCRAALAEISANFDRLGSNGTKVIFVHMSDESTARKYFNRYKLIDPLQISDPECNFYEGFGLVKGEYNQLFGLNSWIRGFSEGIINGHGIGTQLGDGFQMPGVFLIQNGVIKEQYIHRLASDKPDYVKLSDCCII
jgi:peroxiredoxin